MENAQRTFFGVYQRFSVNNFWGRVLLRQFLFSFILSVMHSLCHALNWEKRLQGIMEMKKKKRVLTRYFSHGAWNDSIKNNHCSPSCVLGYPPVPVMQLSLVIRGQSAACSHILFLVPSPFTSTSKTEGYSAQWQRENKDTDHESQHYTR